MRIKSLILTSPPHWHRQQGLPPGPAHPEDIGSWLVETGSLTQRLRNRYGKHFGMMLLQQRYCVPFAEERKALGLSRGARAVIREVALMAESSPVILARSIIPETTVKYADPRLAKLGNQPLGEILFSHPELGRSTLEWCRVPLKLSWQQNQVMGRRSLYTLNHQHPLLVAEFFLPELLDQAS